MDKLKQKEINIIVKKLLKVLEQYKENKYQKNLNNYISSELYLSAQNHLTKIVEYNQQISKLIEFRFKIILDLNYLLNNINLTPISYEAISLQTIDAVLNIIKNTECKQISIPSKDELIEDLTLLNNTSPNKIPDYIENLLNKYQIL